MLRPADGRDFSKRVVGLNAAGVGHSSPLSRLRRHRLSPPVTQPSSLWTQRNFFSLSHTAWSCAYPLKLKGAVLLKTRFCTKGRRDRQTHARARARTHTHTHTRARARARTHARTHTYTHARTKKQLDVIFNWWVS